MKLNFHRLLLQNSFLDIIIVIFFKILFAEGLQAQVIWEPINKTDVEKTLPKSSLETGKDKIQDSSFNKIKNLDSSVIWKKMPETIHRPSYDAVNINQVNWELAPKNFHAINLLNNHQNTVKWEDFSITNTENLNSRRPSRATIYPNNLSVDKTVNSILPPEVIAQEAAMQPRMVPGLPPPPPIQALNRSVAFGDGLVGPDISLRIPNGFRWSQSWFGDVSILGYDYQNGRNPGDPFIPARDSGNLDGWGIIHANVLQTTSWSVALNTSFRSLQNNPDIPGGSTGIEDGVSSGFRIARAIGDTGGIAFGGEQVVQWDDNTDTGRNLYLMASKGWWLGNNGKDYPLFIANGGFGTGRFASLTDKDEPFNFTCTPVESNRKVGKVDENLCWGPIGSASLVFDEWWGTFVEYAIGRATLGISANLTGGIPLRITAGVHFAENDEIVNFDQLRWIAQFSIGF